MFGIDDIALATLGASAIGGISSWLGGSSANKANRNIARETNQANALMNRENMAFQERMSNTSWQRSLADMKAAGVNPMLMASKGGASTPSGSSIGAVTGSPMENTFAGVPQAISSAVGALRASSDINNVHSQTLLNAANAKKVLADAAIIEQNLPKAKLYGTAYDTANKAIKHVSDAVVDAAAPKAIGTGKSLSWWEGFKQDYRRKHNLNNMGRPR